MLQWLNIYYLTGLKESINVGPVPRTQHKINTNDNTKNTNQNEEYQDSQSPRPGPVGIIDEDVQSIENHQLLLLDLQIILHI